MFVALSYNGKLPPYIVECVHQIRIFFEGYIFIITNDLQSEYLHKIKKYDVTITNYDDVVSNEFLETMKINYHKFEIIHKMVGREELFIRSFERFFLLNNLINKYDLEDCLFLELDNLIYENPVIWLSSFSKSELCYMYDNEGRFSSGLMYVKNKNSLSGFLSFCLDYIRNTRTFLDEMGALSHYYELKKDTSIVQILPTYWKTTQYSNKTFINYDKYEETVFDALGIGCSFLNVDPFHSNHAWYKENKRRSLWSAIDYSVEKIKWELDEKGRKKPYIWNGYKWILVNNLHVHSKDLINGLSLPMS